ncbi:MAG: hypothetical protein AAB869_04430, partial [Patescibacteria group bacterium]
MDSDKKTLAELSGEVKEKKYVTLDTGSKISGYTKDYLDRLCRLNKIEHRLSVKGGFVVELGSLLRETHTLLISDDEISFVHKRELVEQPNEGALIPSVATQKWAVNSLAASAPTPMASVAHDTALISPHAQTSDDGSLGGQATEPTLELIGEPVAEATLLPSMPRMPRAPLGIEVTTLDSTGSTSSRQASSPQAEPTPALTATLEPESEATPVVSVPAFVPPTPSEPLYHQAVTRPATLPIFQLLSQAEKISPPPPSRALPPNFDK